jgi:uncharacterized protein HemY
VIAAFFKADVVSAVVTFILYGLYLMRLGDYQRAPVHLSRAMPRTHDRLSTHFLAAANAATSSPGTSSWAKHRSAAGR